MGWLCDVVAVTVAVSGPSGRGVHGRGGHWRFHGERCIIELVRAKLAWPGDGTGGVWLGS